MNQANQQNYGGINQDIDDGVANRGYEVHNLQQEQMMDNWGQEQFNDQQGLHDQQGQNDPYQGQLPNNNNNFVPNNNNLEQAQLLGNRNRPPARGQTISLCGVELTYKECCLLTGVILVVLTGVVVLCIVLFSSGKNNVKSNDLINPDKSKVDTFKQIDKKTNTNLNKNNRNLEGNKDNFDKNKLNSKKTKSKKLA